MLAEFDQQLTRTLDEIRSQGLYKTERIITTPQDAKISVGDGKRVLNMCANNYLGLADHPTLRRRWILMASAWRACVLFAGRRISIKNSKPR